MDAAYKVRDRLIKHGADIHFTRAAVTLDQITWMNLQPVKPRRQTPGPKARGDQPSVELDAIPAPSLRALVRACIQQHLDQDALDLNSVIEKSEKRFL